MANFCCKLTYYELKEEMHLAYGFIEFEDRRDSEEAVRREMAGTSLVVEWSKGCKERNGDYRGRGNILLKAILFMVTIPI